MPRDNFSNLFANKTKSCDVDPSPTPLDGNATVGAAEITQTIQHDAANNNYDRTSSTSVIINGDGVQSETTSERLSTESKPGAESIAYLTRFISPAIQNIRDLKITEKMNALADNLDEYPEKVRRELQNREQARRARREESHESAGEDSFVMVGDPPMRRQSDERMEEECQRLKMQSEEACREIGKGFDALVDFVRATPHGSYEDFIEYLNIHTVFSGTFRQEDLYSCDSHYRKLWNDNLTLGLDGHDCTTLDGRVFVAAKEQNIERSDGLRPQALSGDKKKLSQIDRKKIASSAFHVLSNVSSLAMKPLRDLQMAEKVNAMQLDIEEEETRREIERYYQREEERRDLEEMIRMKKEAEERTLALTKDHLASFLAEHPDATYQEWIEDLVSFWVLNFFLIWHILLTFC
jgi:hypothetical protein